MKTVKIKQVDAFTKLPFGGNPAGVVTDASGLTDKEKQKIAREMNLSETAFVSPSAVADFKVRFFTPNTEVDLCGHATIATFATLHEEGRLAAGKSIFYQETKAGVLPVEVTEVNGETILMMTQAAPKYEDVGFGRDELARALGLAGADLMDTPPQKVSTGLWWLVAGVKELDKLHSAKPNFGAVEELSARGGCVGVIAFSLGTFDPKCGFHLRAFGPLVGINEDPVCGTGSGSASAYITAHDLIPCGDSIDLIVEAGIEVKRPGRVYVSVQKETGGSATVKVGGAAVTVLEGEMRF